MQATLQNSKSLHWYRSQGLKVFCDLGFHATSVAELCRHLSISKAAFIDSFISKEEFFIDITQNLILQQTLDLLIAPVSYRQSPFSLVLDRLEIQLNNAVFNEDDKGFILGNFIAEFHKKNHKVSKYLIDILKLWEINLISLLRKGQLDGYVKQEVDCAGIATYIISSYTGVRSLMLTENSQLLANQFLKQLRKYFNSVSRVYAL